MKRWVMILLAVTSLVLCIASTLLWVRSYLVADQLQKSFAAGYTLLLSDHGELAYVAVSASPPTDPTSPWRWYRAVGGTFGGGYDSFAGSSTANFSAKGTAYCQRSWWVSHWVVALATAILPLAQFGTWWRARRARRLDAHRARGQCTVCGYDLRATPQRCPECGAMVNPPPRVPAELK